VGFKLAEGKGLREGWDSKELWKSVEKVKGPIFCAARKMRHPKLEGGRSGGHPPAVSPSLLYAFRSSWFCGLRHPDALGTNVKQLR
jgi:hypothetical protein